MRWTFILGLKGKRLYTIETARLEKPSAMTWYTFVLRILNPNIPDRKMAVIIITPAGVKSRFRQNLTL